MAPLKSSLARSVAKLLGVSKDTDLSLRGDVHSGRFIPPPPVSASGGTKFTSGDQTYHLFHTSSTLVMTDGPGNLTAEIFLVAGGGAGVDGGGGAVTHAANLRRQSAGAKNFAGFIRCRCNHREWPRQAKVPGRVVGEIADLVAGFDQLRQHLTVNGHGAPLEIPLTGPLVAFVVERDIPHLTAHGVSELACQAVV